LRNRLLATVISLAIVFSLLSPLFPARAAVNQPAALSFACNNPSSPVRIMPLGDSITRGSGSVNFNGYRKPLYTSLTTTYGYSVDFVGSAAQGDFADPDHNGYSGYHARDPVASSIYPNVFNYLDANHADIVLLHIGTNDITFGTQSETEVGDILDEIERYEADSTANQGLGKIHVIVALIINRVPESPDTSSYNNAVKALVETRQVSGDNVSWVDMETALNYTDDIPDGIHPNDSGYAKMAARWLPAIVDLCSGAPTLNKPADRTDAEGDEINLQLVAEDPNGQDLTFEASPLPPGLTLNPDTGLISGTISYEASVGSPYDVLVTVTDPDNNMDSKMFEWTVTNTNREPQLVAPSPLPSHAEGATVSLQIQANDPDGDGLSYAATGLPTGLSINPATGKVTGTVSYDAYTGFPIKVTVTVTDDDGSDPASCDLNSTGRSPPPTARRRLDDIADRSHPEGTEVSFLAKASDPDKDALTFSAEGLPEGLAIDPVSGRISGKIGFNAQGTHTVKIIATDNGLPAPQSSSVTFKWTVTNVNRPPEINDPGPRSAARGEVINLQIEASDPDFDSLKFSATGLPPGLSISRDGLISGKVSKNASFDTPYTVTVTVVDPGGLSDVQSFLWTISGVAPPENPVFLPIVIR
jgi:lysophospholipase L1-like esterase